MAFTYVSIVNQFASSLRVLTTLYFPSLTVRCRGTSWPPSASMFLWFSLFPACSHKYVFCGRGCGQLRRGCRRGNFRTSDPAGFLLSRSCIQNIGDAAGDGTIPPSSILCRAPAVFHNQSANRSRPNSTQTYERSHGSGEKAVRSGSGCQNSKAHVRPGALRAPTKGQH